MTGAGDGPATIDSALIGSTLIGSVPIGSRTIESVTIVGASLAGHATAKALRALGYEGALTIVGGEPHRPYDRPPLSKDFLAGIASIDDLRLETEDEDLGAEWILGAHAIGLRVGDASTHEVVLDHGRVLRSDAVVIATGSTARPLGRMPAGVHTLRSIDDALALREELRPGRRLVVVGAGFVGLEVASTARMLGAEVVVLGSAPLPLSRIFGDTVGLAVQALHERNGVELRGDTVVEAVLGGSFAEGVCLSTGEVIAADAVVVGIGSVPAVGWLAGSGLAIEGGVVTDEQGRAADGIYAVGDCAAWFDSVRGTHHRIEHWTDSRDRATIVASALLGIAAPPRARRPSYLWSDQHGSRIQFAGRLLGGEEVVIEAGRIDTADLLAVYYRDGEPVAVLGIDQPKLVARWRKHLTVLPDSVLIA